MTDLQQTAERIAARLDTYDRATADGWSEELALEVAGYHDPADLRAHLADRRRQAERIAELEGNLCAIRGWTRSNLQILADAQRDWRQSRENAAKMAVLDDLTRVLDHLDTIPAPADTEVKP